MTSEIIAITLNGDYIRSENATIRRRKEKREDRAAKIARVTGELRTRCERFLVFG